MFLNQFLSLALLMFGLVDNAELENPQAPQSCEPVETLIKVPHYYGTLKIWPVCFFFFLQSCIEQQQKRLYAGISALK